MANKKHYNKIQVARGDINNKAPLLGELFYDYESKSVYIGAKNGANVEWKRFGGFDSIVLKGTIDDERFGDLSGLLPGDAYIVTDAISVNQPELIFDGEGNVSRGRNYRTYDDFFKAGQIIVYCAEDLSEIPNAAILDPSTGAGFIPLSGGQTASDIENDVKFQPSAAAADDVDGTKGLNSVQSALDYLFNNKMEYKGKYDEVTITASNIPENPATAEDAVIAAIANQHNLKAGEWIIYNGPTKTIQVPGFDPYVLRKNTAIIKSATVKAGIDDTAGLDTVVRCFPLGAADAYDIEFTFTNARRSAEATSSVDTTSVAGEVIELKNDENGVVDAKVSSVAQALDVLQQTKADLNAQGKIPLSQIPNTFVGALQYIGTVTLADGEDAVSSMTAIEFAQAMSELNAYDSMEKADEGDGAYTEKYRVDNGDYVIVKVPGSSKVSSAEDPDGNETTLKRQVAIVDDEGNVLFRVSEGDHVICNNIVYGDNGSDIRSVKLDHLDTSSSVDAVNGITAEVDVVGSVRQDVNTTKKNETSEEDTQEYPEVVVSVDRVAHQIKITIPNAVLAPANLKKNAIPVGNGDKGLLNSEVSVNGQENDSAYHTDDGTDEYKKHNTELVGKTKDGDDVVVEFPDNSGKMTITSEGSGKEDYIPKYDADGNLIDSDASQNTANKVFTLHDADGNELLKINYGDLAKLLQFGAGADTVTRRFDETVEGVKYTENRNYDENTHTTLDDCSVIDGGEW
jgi:hypothetical protein